jgi:hypothetical protein
MLQTKVVEKIKTHIFLFSNFFFENRPICAKIWKNTEEQGRPQIKIWRMRFACWVPKATHAHTQVVQYSSLFQGNNGCTKAPQCYVIRTLLVLFNTVLELYFHPAFS